MNEPVVTACECTGVPKSILDEAGLPMLVEGIAVCPKCLNETNEHIQEHQMTDPIAEAAASLNAAAQPASVEPSSILDELKGTIHDLQEKVEHLIHPEAANEPAVPTPVAAGSADAAPAADVHAEDATPSSTEPVASAPAVEEQASTIAPEVAPGESVTAGVVLTQQTHTSTPEPAAPVEEIPSSLPSIGSGESISAGESPNAVAVVAGPSSEEPVSAAADLPNAAIAVAEQSATSPSVPPVSMLAGESTSAESSPGEGKADTSASGSASSVTTKAGEAIRTSIANIKNHLSMRGFELSAVADIHNELAAIEKWL